MRQDLLSVRNSEVQKLNELFEEFLEGSEARKKT